MAADEVSLRHCARRCWRYPFPASRSPTSTSMAHRRHRAKLAPVISCPNASPAGPSARPQPPGIRRRGHRLPYALARYARGDQEIEVFVAATERPTQKVTGYAIDLVGPGQWLEMKSRSLSNCLFPRCDEVHTLELGRQFSNHLRHVYYVYVLGGRIIGSAL